MFIETYKNWNIISLLFENKMLSLLVLLRLYI